MLTSLAPLHLGSAHPYEQLLVFALAFGPFVVLGVVVALRRRGEVRREAALRPGSEDARGPAR